MDNQIKVVAISDTHNQTDDMDVPDGDILIFAGDMCANFAKHPIDEIKHFNRFMGKLNFKHKIAIAGNHDFVLDNTANTRLRLLYPIF